MDNLDEINAASSSKQRSDTSTSKDCKINCSNSESLREILDITLNQVSEITKSAYFNSNSSEFMRQFTNVFKNALQENVLVNELPWVVDKSTLTLTEKEDHKQMVDDVLLAKLSKVTSDVAHKRKYYPEQCCRILNVKLKNDMQNLKNAKVSRTHVSLPPLPPIEDGLDAIKRFSEFSRNFDSIRKSVRIELRKKEEMERKIKIATDIQVKTKKRLKSPLRKR